MQIGNIHFGKANSVITPTLSIMEAALLWDMLVARYKCIKETQIYHNYAHDPDWKVLLEYGLSFLEKQANVLEDQVKIYKFPMPERPPVDVVVPENNAVLTDQFMFSQIFEGCQAYIDLLARTSRSMVTNDPLRQIIVDLLTSELSLFDKMIKFAKLKGWLEPSPVYKS